MSKSDPGRDDRLAEKLRENLRRRKSQARARADADAPAPDRTPGPRQAEPDEDGPPA